MPRQRPHVAPSVRNAHTPATIGRPPIISREDVVSAAVAVAERSGIDRLTMSAVAEALGVTTTALYHYVENKQSLVGLVIDDGFDRIQAPPADLGPWDARLREFERVVRQELRRLGIGRLFLDGNEFQRPSVLRLFTIGVEILSETGASEREVRLAFSTVYAYMFGQLRIDSAIVDLPDRELQQIQEASGDEELTSDELFDYGMDVLIAGLREKFGTKRPRRRR